MELRNIYAGKTVLVTGATGLIGSNLVERLLKFKGIRLIAMGRDRVKLERVFARILPCSEFRVMAHDVTQPIPPAVGNVDFIFHAASPISGKMIQEEPVSVIAANLRGTENCLKYLVEQRKATGVVGTFVAFSSATVYGHPAGGDRTFTEDETAEAGMLDSTEAAYSESKRMTEVMARAYGCQFGIDVRIVRFGYVYGHCAVTPKTAFYEFVAKAIRGEDLVFNKSGFARRDNIYIDDAVSGLLCVCEKGVSGEAYNVSACSDGGNYAAIDEMAELIAAAVNGRVNSPIKVVVAPCDQRAAGVRLDNSKLKTLGWRIEHSLPDGISRVVESYASAGPSGFRS